MSVLRLIFFGLLTWAATACASADAQSPDPCGLRSKSAFVAVLVCKPGLTQDEWKLSGEAACLNTPDCSAWMWVDAAQAPAVAPRLADGLSPEQIGNAVAVWDSAGSRLIVIEKIKRE